MRKLDTGGKADLNQKDMGDRRRDRDDRGYDRWDARGSRPFRKEAVFQEAQAFGGAKSKWDKPPDGFMERQTRQAHGRWQGQEERQEEALHSSPVKSLGTRPAQGGAPGFSVKKKGKKKRPTEQRSG